VDIEITVALVLKTWWRIKTCNIIFSLRRRSSNQAVCETITALIAAVKFGHFYAPAHRRK